MRILVVDDDRMMTKTLAEIFHLQGWEVQEAHDGRSAVNALNASPFDVVLMDFRMPGMNGVSAFKAMKASQPNVKVVLMTAFAAQDVLDEAEQEGVLKIMSKPVDIRELLAFLTGALSTKGPVLLVDTDAAFLRTMSEVLELRGFSTVMAGDLAEATRLIRSKRPLAILLHMHLGATAVRDTVAAVHEAGPDAPLILYSGQPGAERQVSADVPHAWVHSFLRRPFAVDHVAGVLSEAVER
ncbi:MAG: response regulator [Gemmatimonadaceae bacterium]